MPVHRVSLRIISIHCIRFNRRLQCYNLLALSSQGLHSQPCLFSLSLLFHNAFFFTQTRKSSFLQSYSLLQLFHFLFSFFDYGKVGRAFQITQPYSHFQASELDNLLIYPTWQISALRSHSAIFKLDFLLIYPTWQISALRSHSAIFENLAVLCSALSFSSLCLWFSINLASREVCSTDVSFCKHFL